MARSVIFFSGAGRFHDPGAIGAAPAMVRDGQEYPGSLSTTASRKARRGGVQ